MVQSASRYDGKCTKWPRFCLCSSAVGTLSHQQSGESQAAAGVQMIHSIQTWNGDGNVGIGFWGTAQFADLKILVLQEWGDYRTKKERYQKIILGYQKLDWKSSYIKLKIFKPNQNYNNINLGFTRLHTSTRYEILMLFT